jgi:hypothetical protein
MTNLLPVNAQLWVEAGVLVAVTDGRVYNLACHQVDYAEGFLWPLITR